MSTIEKLAILSISFISLVATAAISPALNGIQSHFLSASPILIQLIVTLPALICIPISLLNNSLIKFISKKHLIVVGLILFLIGGLSSSLATNIYILLFTRGVLGLGLGITAPLSLVLIGDFFEGKERAKFMGFSTASTNLGGIISTLIVGSLSNLGWRFAFLIYAIVIIVLLLVLFYLPNAETKEKHNKTEKESLHNTGIKIKINKNVIKYSIIIFLALTAFYSIPTTMDFLVKSRSLGSSSTAADLVSLSTLLSLIAAVLFGKSIKIFKKYFSLLVFILMFIGFILIGIGNNLAIISIGAILVGYAFGTIIPYTMFFASNIVHKTHTALAILIITTGLYLGEFLSPIILKAIASILGLNPIAGSFYAAAIIALIALILSIYTAFTEKLAI